jgi:hypothetical protein
MKLRTGTTIEGVPMDTVEKMTSYPEEKHNNNNNHSRWIGPNGRSYPAQEVHCKNQANRLGCNWRNSSINNPYNHAGSITANQTTED